jgi:iron(III) transport system substrate-binding protein
VSVIRRRGVALASAAALLVLAACGGSSSGGASGGTSGAPSGSGATTAPALDKSVTLVVYNAQHDTLTAAWASAFTAQTGVKIEIRKGSDLTMANQIVAEGSASPADVFLTENSPGMTVVENAKLFAAIDKTTLNQVPSAYRPSTGKWVGIAARSTVFAYNPSLLPEADLPESIMDLQKPAWKGKWGAAPKGADFQAIVSAMLELRGEALTTAWLKGMKDNAQQFSGNSAAMKAVNAGTVPGAIIYHYYYYADQAKTKENSSNVKLKFFTNQDPGAFMSVSGGGVLASTKHPVEAQAFVNFVTSQAGQTVLSNSDAFEYSIDSDVAPNAQLKPLSELKPPKLDPASLNSVKVTELMTAAGLL